MEDHAERERLLGRERNLGSLQLHPLVRVRIQLVIEDVQQQDFFPLLARDQRVGLAHRLDAAEKGMLEIVRRGTHRQRLLRDGADHGQHVAHTVIELLDQRELMRLLPDLKIAEIFHIAADH